MTHKALQALNSQVAGETISELAGKEWVWLVSSRSHVTLLATRRAGMIISRVRIVAALFALLTPLWALIDALVFPREIWLPLGGQRVVATAAFVALLFYLRGPVNLRRAHFGLVFLFATPTLLYLFAAALLDSVPLEGAARAVAVTYTFLPFIVLTGLSMFPLTALEALALAAPMLAAKAGLTALYWSSQDWPAALGTYWLLLLVTSVAALASISQLAFVMVLVRQAIRDPMTNCFSRKSGEELLELQFIISARSGAPLTVAFLDLDYFKRVNDEFGHDAGDQALIKAVQQVAGSLRTGDMLTRWGGEEFILIMPNTDCGKAVVALNRLREAGFGLRPEGGPLTASIGVAERLADRAADWKTLVNLADSRMYQAKRSGRNCIVACGPAAVAAATAK